ncbi:hypothetical protein GCM10009843_03640 [Nocardioides bigeumensis]|uniref:Uncharacterized protein n=1 Tax=Nocardioides bigeumensis TaxID=433657 RepID=A0ABP5JAF7_9ACTN
MNWSHVGIGMLHPMAIATADDAASAVDGSSRSVDALHQQQRASASIRRLWDEDHDDFLGLCLTGTSELEDGRLCQA